jgi:hypothetical protein
MLADEKEPARRRKTYTSSRGLRLQRQCPKGRTTKKTAAIARSIIASARAFTRSTQRQGGAEDLQGCLQEGSNAVHNRGRPKDLSWSFITPATTNAANEHSQKLIGCRCRRQEHCTPHAAPHQSPAYRAEATATPHATVAPGTPPLRRRRTAMPWRLAARCCPEPPCSPQTRSTLANQEQRRQIEPG